MKFEHIALNVLDAKRMADWYAAHLGMRIVLSMEEEPFTRFLADETGRVVFEIYTNPKVTIPDYWAMHPLNLHRAFAVEDAHSAQTALVAAGATYLETVRPPDGSALIMLRDPWGVPLQICRRAKPFRL
jgi:catechol 2,3-dioxygenase-like lactoylglutathione lyase family enzyme